MTVAGMAQDQLKRAVEAQHDGTTTLLQSLPVSETFDGKTGWAGVVHVFALTGHPKANRALSLLIADRGDDKRRFFAMLQQGPVTSPVEAVRAAIVAEQRGRE